MKSVITIFLMFGIQGLASSVELNCVPSYKVSSSLENSIREEMKATDATKNALKIVKKGKTFIVATRNNIEVIKTNSGIFELYTNSAFSAKIDTTSKDYFEFVHLGLGTITYFGKCL